MFELEKYIQEDVAYGDLTTQLQGEANFRTRLEIFSRDEILVSGSEISAKIGEILGCESEIFIKSRNFAKKNDKIVAICGDYKNIHKAWKLAQVFLEYSCAIATYTHKMVQSAKNANPKCQILGTRKTFPFAKKFCLNALCDGGGFIHRINLSDSVLFFDKHRIVYQNDAEFYAQIAKFKQKLPEKKIVIEALNLRDAKELLNHGADAVQLDKMDFGEISEVVKFRDLNCAGAKILCAGGINLQNAKDYAKLGIDAIVTSAMYQAKMADIGARIEKI